ncbi:MAG: hypothetical protein IJH53_05585 [Oscillospiraceae bacterium]|nr:hypothetical protein [Oscillospiraceae bacterium]
MKREQLSSIICNIDEQLIAEAHQYDLDLCSDSPERIVYMNKKRIVTFALAAVLMLAFGITAYAIWGVPQWTATHNMENTGEYTSLSDLPEVEKIVGYEICLVDRFTNGFAFSKLRVDGLADYDEDYNILKEYYGVNATYRTPNGAEMLLSLSPVSDNSSSQETRAASSGCVIGETEVKIYRDHYKFVPEDYEKSPEDVAAEAGGHYYISFGAEQIEERDIVSADVVLNDVNYTFYFDNAAECSDEMLIQMASELVEAAK